MKKKWMLFPALALTMSGCATVDKLLEQPAPPQCDIAFDVNRDVIRASEQSKIANYASELKADTLLRYRLEGHADERADGSYNFDLALRRSWAVKRALMALGTSESQLDLQSYGKNVPLVHGTGEAVWAKNRCVSMTPTRR